MNITPPDYVTDGGGFQDGLSLLQEQLPYWWATQDESSQLHLALCAIAAQFDSLSATLDAIFSDRVLNRATSDGLNRIWSVLWSVQGEQLPDVQSVLVPYIQARMAEDGSTQSLVNTLMATITSTPVNLQAGTVAVFPAYTGLSFPTSGGLVFGLTFPASPALVFAADGSGVTLWQWDGTGSHPLPAEGLFFPASGGFTFPYPPYEIVTDAALAYDGTAGTATPYTATYPLTFALNSAVEVIQDFADYSYAVTVKSALTFDRPAFARAVNRFRPAHCLPPTITEVP